ncbi:MAG: prefoldin subunit alpha [Nitrososphaerales archaeon]
MSVEEKIQRMLVELRALETYYNELTTRETLVARAILDSRATLNALKSIPEGSDSEILLPLGAGVLMRVKSPKADTLLINLGAGVVIEKNKEYVLNYLTTRISELENALSNISAQKTELENKINSHRAEVNNLAASLQTG